MAASLMKCVALLLVMPLIFMDPFVNAEVNGELYTPKYPIDDSGFFEDPTGGDIGNIPAYCVPPEKSARIFTDLSASVARLKELGIIKDLTNIPPPPKFIFPLVNLLPSKYKFAWAISNYVDHEPNTGSLQDYACGARTYDIEGYNHKGIDGVLWPFPWLMKQEGAVGIVAAADGIIIGKEDGNDDNSCDFSNPNWNAVYLRHNDGSVSWYGHMKKGSVTTKAVGKSVKQGEQIGLVASSGSSTAPHIHFEVYDRKNNLVDPFAGTCNKLNKNSWWKKQQDYWLPRLHYIALVCNSAPLLQFSTNKFLLIKPPTICITSVISVSVGSWMVKENLSYVFFVLILVFWLIFFFFG